MLVGSLTQKLGKGSFSWLWPRLKINARSLQAPLLLRAWRKPPTPPARPKMLLLPRRLKSTPLATSDIPEEMVENEQFDDSPTPTFNYQDFAKMKFSLRNNTDFQTAYSALVFLEREFPELVVATKVTLGISIIIYPKNEASVRFLLSTHTLIYNKTVALEYLGLEEATKKTILIGYPHEFLTDALEKLPNVVCICKKD